MVQTQSTGHPQQTFNSGSKRLHLKLRGFNEKLQSRTLNICAHLRTTLGQIIEIVDVSGWGKCLRLNGDLMAIEKNQDGLHQIMVKLGLQNLDRNARSITILGGGDGGILKHSLRLNPDQINLLELDPQVISFCKKYLPHISNGAFDDNKVNLIIGDAFVNITNLKDNSQDIVFVDMTDGGAISNENQVFGPRSDILMQNINRILSNKGVVVCQANEQPQDVLKNFKKYFEKSYCWSDSFEIKNANCYVYSVND